METGIYRMQLKSSGNIVEAEALLVGNKLKGGGQGYSIQGCLQEKDTVLTGTVNIKKRDKQTAAVLGLFKEVTFEITGRYEREKNAFYFEGRFQAHHSIVIRATGCFAKGL
jgi:hypothetical protein